MATGMWGQDETEIQPSAIMSPHKIPEGDIIWYGLVGPEVWVGPMREFSSQQGGVEIDEIEICSRSDIHSDVICTSSSTPAFRELLTPIHQFRIPSSLPVNRDTARDQIEKRRED